MFSYSPTENDQSGRIIAGGMMGAAETNANTMNQLGQNIGGALQSIGGAIGGVMEKNAMGDTAYEALGAIGEMYPGMKSAFTALGKMDPRTRRLASMSILDNLGAVSQLGIAGMRNSTTQQGQQLATDRMYTQEQLRRERDAINNPPPPQPMPLPQGIRRFNTGTTQGS